MKPLTSVIIVNYNGEKYLGGCLGSLLSNVPKGTEIIVVDNASSDDSRYLLDSYDGKLKLILSDKNLGFGGGNNAAAKEAKGEYLFFLNGDTIITEDIFSEALSLFAKDERIGIVAPRLLLPSGEEQEYAFGSFPSLFGSLFNKPFTPIIKEGKVVEADWVSGAAFFIKKKLFLELGGFDEHYFMYFEDVDLCRTVKRQGYKNVSVRNISLIHLGGKSLGDDWRRKKAYYKSQNYYYFKNHGLLAFLAMKALRLPYMAFKYLLMVFTRNKNKA